MRVTECAQQAVLHARGEAGRLGHDRIGTEHLLLALLRDQGCLATAILGERGVEVDTLRRRVEERAGPGLGGAAAGGATSRDEDLLAGLHLPMTKPVTLVFGLAAREARELEQDRVGTEHLLLGLAREGDGVAARALEDAGAGLVQLREAVPSVYSSGADPEPLPDDRGPP
ncbi:MAG TPA: Clp protease N-terminal domain-containing protein, partial [Actinomycetes bacterium]|nr:Clp protease N-terminal domain-containing protein [Actinomycetes bacterium]